MPLQTDIVARQAALAESGAEQDKTSAELREASLVLEALQLRESVARQAVGELRQARARPWDETCPVSTGGGTRRVQSVREGGGGEGEHYH